MATKDEVISAYRYLLGRAPENEEVIARWQNSDFEAMRTAFIQSAEFEGKHARLKRGAAIVAKQDAAAAFEATLGRPMTEAEWGKISGAESTSPVVKSLFLSSEFAGHLGSNLTVGEITEWDYGSIYSRFPPASVPSKRGFSIGALGDSIATAFDVSLREGRQATIPKNCEYWAALYAASTARERFVAIELGAGYGTWIVRAGLAARAAGLAEVKLHAVEADSGHYEFLLSHLAENGLSSNTVPVRAAIGRDDGFAYFPILRDPAADWGASAMTNERYSDLATEGEPLDRLKQPMERVPSISIRSVLAEYEMVDFLHIDIQGAEADALDASFEEVSSKVRVLFVGTHTHQIEMSILKRFGSRNHWKLKHFTPRRYLRNQREEHIGTADGEMVWINDGLEL